MKKSENQMFREDKMKMKWVKIRLPRKMKNWFTYLPHLVSGTDKRVHGIVNQGILDILFKNLSKSESESDPFDNTGKYALKGYRYEGRIVEGVKAQAKKIVFIPSSMRGKGRVYNKADFLRKLRNIRGFILLNPQELPEYVEIMFLPVEKVLSGLGGEGPTKGISLSKLNRFCSVGDIDKEILGEAIGDAIKKGVLSAFDL